MSKFEPGSVLVVTNNMRMAKEEVRSRLNTHRRVVYITHGMSLRGTATDSNNSIALVLSRPYSEQTAELLSYIMSIKVFQVEVVNWFPELCLSCHEPYVYATFWTGDEWLCDSCKETCLTPFDPLE